MSRAAAGLLLAVLLASSTSVDGHAALFLPPPLNAEDRSLPPWAGGKSPATPCTCANGLGGPNASQTGCDEGLRGQGGGQSCLWWSQGCSIGCKACATATDPTSPITGAAPHADKIGFRTRYCNDSSQQPTLPREAWTMNVHAVEGAADDSYRFNPWRAPGSAPMVDACGQAGGKFANTPIGGDSVFTPTPLAKMGDMGTKVLFDAASSSTGPRRPSTRWAAGSSVEVAWGIRYNHGGGYQYRLCPASERLSEECFQRHPLQFVRDKQALVWNNGTRLPILGVFVDTGVRPEGSTWARNPIPRINDDNIGLSGDPSSCPGPNGRSGKGCIQFPAPCPQDSGPYAWSTDGSGQGACSGDWTAGLISDHVLIPASTLPGNYVLGWRWDCEETAQIWSNCASVTVTSGTGTATATSTSSGAAEEPPKCSGLPGYFSNCGQWGGSDLYCCDERYSEAMRSMCSHPQAEGNVCRKVVQMAGGSSSSTSGTNTSGKTSYDTITVD